MNIREQPFSDDYHRLNTSSPDKAGGEVLLRSDNLQIENKAFEFSLRENVRGRFLRISEINKTGRRNNIIIPCGEIAEFTSALARMTTLSKEIACKAPE